MCVCDNNNNSRGREFEKEGEVVNLADQMEGQDGGRGRTELNSVLPVENLKKLNIHWCATVVCILLIIF